MVKWCASRSCRSVLVVTCCLVLAGCGLPRSGPSKAEFLADKSQAVEGLYVVAVTEAITRATAHAPALGFPPEFTGAGAIGADAIRPGDRLALRIWENVEDGLLAGAGQNTTVLDNVQVDDAGFIFVPYAGRLQAAGLAPDGLRALITRRLADQTPDPQVTVARQAGDGAAVAVLGDVGAQGVYPIERPTLRLTGMLARAGGVQSPAEVTRVTLRRGGSSGHAWLTDVYAHPGLDVAIRPGDVVVVEKDRRSFVALGATGGQQRVAFDKQDLSALEAIAQAGGLSSQLADPTGVFVLRRETAAVANAVLGRDLSGPQRIVYAIDLTVPGGLFLARDFAIRDGDAIYVTEAPYVGFQKALQVLTGSAAAVNSVNGLSGN